jgi:hypothetical protein
MNELNSNIFITFHYAVGMLGLYELVEVAVPTRGGTV